MVDYICIVQMGLMQCVPVVFGVWVNLRVLGVCIPMPLLGALLITQVFVALVKVCRMEYRKVVKRTKITNRRKYNGKHRQNNSRIQSMGGNG